jgi:hypothetical protein
MHGYLNGMGVNVYIHVNYRYVRGETTRGGGERHEETD